MFIPAYMPCEECGAPVKRDERDEHVCDPERKLDYEMFRLREEVSSFDAHLACWLASPHGQFEIFCAERERKK